MKRRILLPVLAGLLFMGFMVGPVSAHVLKIDGDIGVVLHINPDDNPTTGGPTQYILYFTDTTGRFTLPKCNCGVAIQVGGKTIYSHPLTVTSSLDSVDTYTFPKPDVYNLQISGMPKVPSAFQPFVLNYLVRVTSGSSGTQPFPVLLWVGMAMMIGLILLGAYKSEHNGKR